MTRNGTNTDRRAGRHARIRKKIRGTQERPRLSVFRSLKHMYAQLTDDSRGTTILAASTVKLAGKKLKNGGNVAAAKEVGENIAQAALEKGIQKVIFDRGGYIYKGRVKALAEAARASGLRF